MLKRIIAVLTTLLLAIGLTVGVSAAASAHDANYSVDCAGLNLNLVKYGASTTNYVTVTIDGSVVADKVLFNDTFAKSYPMPSTTASHSYKIEIDAQGTGYDKLGANAITGTWVPCASTGLTCDVSTLTKGSPLTNGDHINMNVTRNGGGTFQVNAFVDIRQDGDPVSESGLVVRIHLDSGNTVIALTNAQKASGILNFEYSKTWTGTWTIQWVQYNSSYFNQNNDASKFKNCAKDTPVAIQASPTASQPTCSADGALVIPAPPTGITWSGGANGAGPGTYTIVATPSAGYTLNGAQNTWVVQVLPKGTGLDCGPPPCIASSQVSYTYDAATNSGVVTVPNPAGSSGKLCDGFWVTAVAWKFTGSGVWPQALDTNNPMPEKAGSFFVDEPGTYPYGADVECGQGDIYASYDAQPVPTAVLNGPNNPYSEHFLHQMGFSGPNPTYTVDAPGCNKATPVTPTATPIVACGTDGSIVAGPTTGVVYSLTGGNGTTGAWEITATPAANYYFTGAQAVKFTGDLGERTDCTLPTEPQLTYAVCNTTTGIVASAYIVIPDTTGLQYRVDGTLQAKNTKVDLGVGSHTVKVETLAGYTNTGATEYTIVVENDPDCDDPVEYLVPGVQHEICDATTGNVSGGELTFTKVEHLTYFVDGTEVVFPAGQTTVTLPVTAGSHTVKYEAEDGFYLKGTQGLTTKSETIEIITPATCDDPVKYEKPGLEPESCDATLGGSKDGIVTFTLPEHLTYVFDGTEVTSADLTIEKPAGTYQLVVTAADGYFITGGGTTETYSITVAPPEDDCATLITLPLDPYPTHQDCVAGSLTGEITQGSITIVKAEHVTWTISNDLDGIKVPVDTSGVGPNFAFPYSAGNYHVWATADPGYVLEGSGVFPVQVKAPEFDCDLITHAELPTGISWTNQVCTPSGLVDPTITVDEFPGVSYFIDGVIVTKKTTTVTPGTHLVTAAADDPTNTVTTASWSPPLLVAASAICGDLTTLAFTGETPGGWLILAFVLLQAGFVLLAIRFVRTRRERARHLA